MSAETQNSESSKNFEARSPNWLPVPSCERSHSTQNVEENDLFPKGDVVEFFLQQGRGVVEKQGGGVRYPFNLDVIEIVGAKQVSQLVVGMKVGYDIARTSEGPRITKLKIY